MVSLGSGHHGQNRVTTESYLRLDRQWCTGAAHPHGQFRSALLNQPRPLGEEVTSTVSFGLPVLFRPRPLKKLSGQFSMVTVSHEGMLLCQGDMI